MHFAEPMPQFVPRRRILFFFSRHLRVLASSVTLFIVSCGSGTGPNVAVVGGAVGCYTQSVSPVQACFFVSSLGDDTWSGSEGRPFRTIVRAQESVREISAQMVGDIVVMIRMGDYFLGDTLLFTEQDSGTNGYRVIYKSADGAGSARLIGGVRISNWVRYTGNILQATAPPGLQITTLYEDGVRADEARFPHRVGLPALPMSHSPYLTSANSPASSFMLAGSGELPPLAGDLTGLKVFIWAGHDWFTDIIPVASVDSAANQYVLAQEARYPIVAGSRYFLEGALSLLGAPGEFFHDAKNGILYYWPRAADVDNHEIIAPILKTILSVRGSSAAQPVRNLQFNGLTLEGSNFVTWYRFGWPRAGQSGESHLVPAFDRQIEMAPNRLGMVSMENTDGVDLLFSHFKDSGMGAIYLKFGNRHDCICGNLIEHVGINGITLQGQYPGEGDVLHDNVISNNLIRYVGEMAGNAAGVDISNSGSNEVSYSEIHDSPRYAVLWHAGVPPGIPSYVEGNVFKYLRISLVGQDSGDTGAVYAFQLSADSADPRANSVAQVVISSVHADASMLGIPPFGVYMDNDSSGQTLGDIRVGDTAGPPFFQHSTGVMYLDNVSWEAGFDNSRIDDAHIGLRPDFPRNYLQ